MIYYDRLIPGIQWFMNSIGHKDVFAFDQWADVSQAESQQVKILLIRSTTQVDQQLLDQCPNLEFVGSATSGIDHIAVDLLAERGISWCEAKGSNAKGVADYVVFALAVINYQASLLVNVEQSKNVILGYGHVGQEVGKNLTHLGMQWHWVDPHKTADQRTLLQGGEELEHWLETTHLLTVHLPLIASGEYPTAPWLNEQRLSRLPNDAWIILAGRGGNADEAALLKHSTRLNYIIDVWPHEPCPSPQLIQASAFATPHIAGHSRLSKIRGSWQILQELVHFLAIDKEDYISFGDFKMAVLHELQIEATHVELASKTHVESIQDHLRLQIGFAQMDTYLRAAAESQSNEAYNNTHIMRQAFQKARAEYGQHLEIVWGE